MSLTDRHRISFRLGAASTRPDDCRPITSVHICRWPRARHPLTLGPGKILVVASWRHLAQPHPQVAPFAICHLPSRCAIFLAPLSLSRSLDTDNKLTINWRGSARSLSLRACQVLYLYFYLYLYSYLYLYLSLYEAEQKECARPFERVQCETECQHFRVICAS